MVRDRDPHKWERITALIVAVGIVALVSFLIVRNQPFADPNLIVALRTILSLATATLGATIPGFLNVSWRGSGALIRAGGALALFLLTYKFTPDVLPLAQIAEELAIADDRANVVRASFDDARRRALASLARQDSPTIATLVDKTEAGAVESPTYLGYVDTFYVLSFRFEQLHLAYKEAVELGQRIRAGEIRNKIHVVQLTFAMLARVAEANGQMMLTNEITLRIADEIGGVAYLYGGTYVANPAKIGRAFRRRFAF